MRTFSAAWMPRWTRIEMPHTIGSFKFGNHPLTTLVGMERYINAKVPIFLSLLLH